MPVYASRGQGQGQVTYLSFRINNENARRHLNLNISTVLNLFFSRPEQTMVCLWQIRKIWLACGVQLTKYGAAKKVRSSNAPAPASRGLIYNNNCFSLSIVNMEPKNKNALLKEVSKFYEKDRELRKSFTVRHFVAMGLQRRTCYRVLRNFKASGRL